MSKNKKNNVYPCQPQFYYIKVGFKEVNIIQVWFHEGSKATSGGQGRKTNQLADAQAGMSQMDADAVIFIIGMAIPRLK